MAAEAWRRGARWFAGWFARWLAGWFAGWLGLAVLVMLAACGEPQPWRIGFVGGLSGRVSDLGIGGRNGVLLAVEQANAAGGVAGRPVELIVRDDGQRVDAAQRAVSELLAARVALIIGPMTSAMAEVVVPLTRSSGLVVISPTVANSALAGQDDHFIRVSATSREYAVASADYLVRRFGARRVAIILDAANAAFTEDWVRHFAPALEAGGGQVVAVERYQSAQDASLLEPVARLLGAQPQAVLIAAGAVDMARISQLVRRSDAAVVLMSTNWAATEELVTIGGRAVEGAVMPQAFDRDDRSAAFTAFREAYQERFGSPPGFAAVAAYDAARVGLDALARAGEPRELRQALLNHEFDGLQQRLHIDRWGDAQRDIYMTVIRDGRFRLDAKLSAPASAP